MVAKQRCAESHRHQVYVTFAVVEWNLNFKHVHYTALYIPDVHIPAVVVVKPDMIFPTDYLTCVGLASWARSCCCGWSDRRTFLVGWFLVKKVRKRLTD